MCHTGHSHFVCCSLLEGIKLPVVALVQVVVRYSVPPDAQPCSKVGPMACWLSLVRTYANYAATTLLLNVGYRFVSKVT